MIGAYVTLPAYISKKLILWLIEAVNSLKPLKKSAPLSKFESGALFHSKAVLSATSGTG